MSKTKNSEQEYWDDVKDMADDIETYAKDNDWPEREDVLQYCHESIDGCARVIYTASAKECVLISPNEGAYVDNFGSDGLTDKGGNINWSAMAYCAFEADIFEELRTRGFDVNDDNPGKPEDEEEA